MSTVKRRRSACRSTAHYKLRAISYPMFGQAKRRQEYELVVRSKVNKKGQKERGFGQYGGYITLFFWSSKITTLLE